MFPIDLLKHVSNPTQLGSITQLMSSTICLKGSIESNGRTFPQINYAFNMTLVFPKTWWFSRTSSQLINLQWKTVWLILVAADSIRGFFSHTVWKNSHHAPFSWCSFDSKKSVTVDKKISRTHSLLLHYSLCTCNTVHRKEKFNRNNKTTFMLHSGIWPLKTTLTWTRSWWIDHSSVAMLL